MSKSSKFYVKGLKSEPCFGFHKMSLFRIVFVLYFVLLIHRYLYLAGMSQYPVSQNFPKSKLSYPQTDTLTCVYQG